ncbi:MAG: hypothetical protein M1814_001925 [Vezdaea aestivalis]|nr:MAG: hypothetical protein M1814_001925 [Vezdaea aestivalis]
MSFGFAVGDFIAVGTLAWNVYKAYRGAPDSFKNISVEVLSLHGLLKEVEENFLTPNQSPAQRLRLENIYQGCMGVLSDLDALMKKYESLSVKNKINFDRFGYGTQDIAEYRARITSNVVLLTAFISTSPATVQKQLNALLRDYQAGNREGSIATISTTGTFSSEDKVTWREIRKELEEVGITVAAFYANKAFILDWFIGAVESGAFNEQSCEVALSDSPRVRQSLDQQSQATPSETARKTRIKTVDPYRQQSSQGLLTSGSADPSLNKGQTSHGAPSPQVKALLDVGADVNTQGEGVHGNALQFFCTFGTVEDVQEIIDKGADVNAQCGSYGNALQAAVGAMTVFEQNIPIVKLLLDAGANVNAQGGYDGTALLAAIDMEADFALLELLLDAGADVDDKAVKAAQEQDLSKESIALLQSASK